MNKGRQSNADKDEKEEPGCSNQSSIDNSSRRNIPQVQVPPPLCSSLKFDPSTLFRTRQGGNVSGLDSQAMVPSSGFSDLSVQSMQEMQQIVTRSGGQQPVIQFNQYVQAVDNRTCIDKRVDNSNQTHNVHAGLAAVGGGIVNSNASGIKLDITTGASSKPQDRKFGENRHRDTEDNRSPNPRISPRDDLDTAPRREEGTSTLEQEFIDLYNKETDSKTKDKVTATFDYLKTPGKQVHPIFLRTNFYQGDTSLSSAEYEPDPSYTNEKRRYSDIHEIEMHQFLESVRYTALVAGAGEGKTTAAKRYAQKALRKEIPNMEEVELAHFVSIAELDWEDRYTAYDLIFNQTMGSKVEEVKEFGYNWMKRNARKVLIILDGLDQAPWELGEDNRTISYDKKATAPVLFHNILNKDLFHGCKILITTREHAIRKCPAKFRPQKIVSLLGLKVEDREYLVNELGGEKGSEIWKHLKQKSPGLLSLCSSPMYLVMSVAIWVENFENPPDTMSGILIRVLVYFMNSENKVSKNIDVVLTKLSELAYNGTMRREVLFHHKEIKNLGLGVKDVTDLLITTPGRSTPSRSFQLMEGHLRLFFFHQALQEVLAALHIVKMPLQDFKNFMKEHFSSDHFLIIRHFIAGILLNNDVNSSDNSDVIGEILDYGDKQSTLKKWIADEIHLQEQPPKDDSVSADQNKSYLFSILHECGDGVNEIINKNFKMFIYSCNLYGIGLFHVVHVMSRWNNMSNARLGEISPTEDQLEAFSMAVRNCNHCEIGRLNLCEVGQFVPDNFCHIVSILNNSTVKILSIRESSFTEKNIEKLQDFSSKAQSAKSAKIRYLMIEEDFRYQTDEAKLYFLGKSLTIWNVHSLVLSYFECTVARLQKLLESLRQFKGQIKELCFGKFDIKVFHHGYISSGLSFISRNTFMGDEEFNLIAQIINQAKVEQVNLINCNFRLANSEKFRDILDNPSNLMIEHEINPCRENHSLRVKAVQFDEFCKMLEEDEKEKQKEQKQISKRPQQEEKRMSRRKKQTEPSRRSKRLKKNGC